MSIKVAIHPTYALLDCSILSIPECGPVYSNQKGAFCYECGDDNGAWAILQYGGPIPNVKICNSFYNVTKTALTTSNNISMYTFNNVTYMLTNIQVILLKTCAQTFVCLCCYLAMG